MVRSDPLSLLFLAIKIKFPLIEDEIPNLVNRKYLIWLLALYTCPNMWVKHPLDAVVWSLAIDEARQRQRSWIQWGPRPSCLSCFMFTHSTLDSSPNTSNDDIFGTMKNHEKAPWWFHTIPPYMFSWKTNDLNRFNPSKNPCPSY